MHGTVSVLESVSSNSSEISSSIGGYNHIEVHEQSQTGNNNTDTDQSSISVNNLNNMSHINVIMSSSPSSTTQTGANITSDTPLRHRAALYSAVVDMTAPSMQLPLRGSNILLQ